MSLARSLGAELVIIAIVATETFATPVAMGSPGLASLRSDIERHVQEELHKVAAGIPADVTASTKRLTGDAEQLLTEQTEELDILVTGSRGYGPLRAVLAGGLSGRLARTSHCPVIMIPRGIEAPLETFATEVGAEWAGGSDEAPPEPLDAAIIFAPDGALVPAVLAVLAPGGTLVLGGIHMTDIPSFPYELLRHERTVRSVANLTRRTARSSSHWRPRCQ